MEWVGVLIMLLVAALAAAMCDGIVRLLAIAAPAKPRHESSQPGFGAGG